MFPLFCCCITEILFSRIIEIAGGREVFCQSRSKPGRKGRHVRESRDRDEANSSKTNKTETSERRVWELRSRFVPGFEKWFGKA